MARLASSSEICKALKGTLVICARNVSRGHAQPIVKLSLRRENIDDLYGPCDVCIPAHACMVSSGLANSRLSIGWETATVEFLVPCEARIRPSSAERPVGSSLLTSWFS